MYEANALGFEPMRAKSRDELGAARCRKDDRDPPSVANVATRSGDEFNHRCARSAPRLSPAAIRAFLAGIARMKRGIRNYQVKARRTQSGNLAIAKVGANAAQVF